MSQSNTTNQTLQLENCLFKYCRAGSTGTIFITSENHRSCQIVLKDGAIKSISFGDERGFGAILELKEAAIVRFSFIQGKQLSLPIYSDILCSDAALFHLGYCANNISSSNIFLKSKETPDQTC